VIVRLLLEVRDEQLRERPFMNHASLAIVATMRRGPLQAWGSSRGIGATHRQNLIADLLGDHFAAFELLARAAFSQQIPLVVAQRPAEVPLPSGAFGEHPINQIAD
jgi:hypothetical protein